MNNPLTRPQDAHGESPVTVGQGNPITGSPGGSNTQIQYNNLAAFGGCNGLTWDGTSLLFGTSQQLRFRDANAYIYSSLSGILRIIATNALRHISPDIQFYADTGLVRKILELLDASSSVNYVELRAAATGVNPNLTAVGTDTDVGFNVKTKNAGHLQENGANVVITGGPLGIPSSGTLTNCGGLPSTGLAMSAADKVIGRSTAGPGASEEITCTASARTALALNATSGDLIYASAANTWAVKAKGTAYQVLRMNSGATAPEWGAVPTKGKVIARVIGVLPPIVNPATPSVRITNSGNIVYYPMPMWDFDKTTAEFMTFLCYMEPGYTAAIGLTIEHWWTSKTLTSGGTVWAYAIRRYDTGEDIDDAATYTLNLTGTSTAPAAAGKPVKVSLDIATGTNTDNLAADELFTLTIKRAVAEAGDDLNEDAQLIGLPVILET